MTAEMLLKQFWDISEKTNLFLKQEHHFQTITGLHQVDRGRSIIKPLASPSEATYPFYATTRYEREEVCVEFLYGDYNYALECFITYNRYQRFSLQDLIEANDVKPISAPIYFNKEGAPPVAPQTHHVTSILKTYSATLAAYATDIINPSADLIEKAVSIREEKTQIFVRGQYERAKKAACKKAAEAFSGQDYKRAIMLYRPYKDDLEPHESRLFALAIYHLGE